jgi:AraC-like DNA-binding protein
MKRPSARPAAQSALNATPEFFSAQVIAARRVYLNLNPPASERLAVVCGGLEDCQPDYAVQRDTFPFYSVEYVARGRGSLTLGQRHHRLVSGRLFAYGPGIRHTIQSDSDVPLVKYFVDFTGQNAGRLLKAARLRPGQVADIFPPHEAQGLFDELIASGMKGTPRSRELCLRLLECLLLKISEAHAPVEGMETRAFTTYQQCREHLQRHFLRLRTLDQLAEECHADRAYLCRLFRRYDHQSPYQYLLRLKLKAAAELLKTRGAMVKQVADQVGFGDACHFSRTFKAAFGLSPDAFRHLRQI